MWDPKKAEPQVSVGEESVDVDPLSVRQSSVRVRIVVSLSAVLAD